MLYFFQDPMAGPSSLCEPMQSENSVEVEPDLTQVKEECVAGEEQKQWKPTEKEANGGKGGENRSQKISASTKKRELEKMLLEASKKKRALKKKLLESSLKKRTLKKMLEESKKKVNIASLVGESIPAQETFTNRKRPIAGSVDLELASASTPPSSSSLISLENLEAEDQADIQCYGCDLPFPSEESLLLPNRSSGSRMVTIRTLKSRMPSIASQAGSSQQRCPETSCSSHANSCCRGQSWFLCDECGNLFKHPDSLTHHRKTDRGGFKCSTCGNIHMMGPMSVSPMHSKSLEVEGRVGSW